MTESTIFLRDAVSDEDEGIRVLVPHLKDTDRYYLHVNLGHRTVFYPDRGRAVELIEKLQKGVAEMDQLIANAKAAHNAE